MGCAMGTVRYILFFFNFLLALAGLGILTLGVMTAHAQGSSINDILHSQLTTPAILFSVVGACIFVFAFFGCCGALRESHCMICTYAVLLLTLFLLQVAVAVFAYTNKGQAKDLIYKGVEERFSKYKDNNATMAWVNSMQQELKCCGSDNPQTPWDVMNIPQPPSCYPNKDMTKNTFPTGCIPALNELVTDRLSDITKVAIAVAAVQVVGIVFALCLANSIRRQEFRGYA